MNGVNELDLSLMRYVKVRPTNTANIWHISLPIWPWKYDHAEQERQFIIEKLSTTFPYKTLWLSDWASDTPGWHPLDNSNPTTLKEEFSYGMWALFFFKNTIKEITNKSIPIYPKNTADATNQIKNFGANAAIWSWYDDAEWLVAFPSRQ